MLRGLSRWGAYFAMIALQGTAEALLWAATALLLVLRSPLVKQAAQSPNWRSTVWLIGCLTLWRLS